MNKSWIVLRLDPWPPEYEAAVQLDFTEPERQGNIDPAVETSDWKPVRPTDLGTTADLYFVDGVRRVEARVLADHEKSAVHGLFGSIAVGAVHSRSRKASFEEISTKRFLVLGCGLQQEELIEIGKTTLLFEGYSIPENTPLEILSALQNLMRNAEAELAQQLVSRSYAVFVDGPLTYFSLAKQDIVGIVKRLYLQYLDDERFKLVPILSVGERTPLFMISDGKYDRYSWFLRVARPGPTDHSLSGVLRLEIRSAVGLEKARELAGLSAGCLPTFASTSVREPRAPQNLLPISALEFELRRYLGDSLTIRRTIEKRIFQSLSYD